MWQIFLQYDNDIENGKHNDELGTTYFWRKSLGITAFWIVPAAFVKHPKLWLASALDGMRDEGWVEKQ